MLHIKKKGYLLHFTAYYIICLIFHKMPLISQIYLFLTLREERRLRVFENRVLRRMFGAKRDEVARGWRKLHNEKINDLHCSPNITRVIK